MSIVRICPGQVFHYPSQSNFTPAYPTSVFDCEYPLFRSDQTIDSLDYLDRAPSTGW